jgi:hypothetical protein
MERMTFAPTVAADIAAIGGEPPFRLRAVTARVGERIVGIGGFGYLEDGSVLAWASLTDEARRHKVSLHKRVCKALRWARAR